MDPEQLLREGALAEALSALQAEVRSAPRRAEPRIFLFQLLAIMGEWNRALTQLEVVGEIDASSLAMVQTYREALRCEFLRAEVFAGRVSPLVFGDPERWVALLAEALRLIAKGEYVQSEALRTEAFELASPTAGAIDGQAFMWIADADTRLGPAVEVIVNGRYYWVPFVRIRAISLEAPTDLRDLVWMPAQFTWSNGGQAVGFIPTRYPGSEASTDTRIRLGRRTEWVAYAGGVYLGLGQRMLVTDTGEHALMDTRQIRLGAGAQTSVDAEVDAPNG